ncbi:uncharacterized protein TRIVIDRAFT_63783 [Trichoderma virens Gv29-8]|uniref:Uncharacterized protein n=1 Tax=Hypocrea virens (strain Gv29-8 / FGSC 10586) TaxID=413071 RepID=G9MG32_HYPVG|nr:uncharacterized protein TRIVIDRAFT_63783 [Trichoderma virens Gv29-8]EHK26482.1 hypothetical protein TRIVIDRAFT_63783 [Trichoderma virens Gv29-8]
MDRLRPPTGSILPVAGDGAVQGVRAPRALSRLGSTVRGYWEKLLEHLLSCWQWILFTYQIDELRARLGILVGTCLAMAAIMGTFVSWEHLHGNLFSVLPCILSTPLSFIQLLWKRYIILHYFLTYEYFRFFEEEATDPPPYEEHNGTAKDCDKIFVPAQIMGKIMAIDSHHKRVRLVNAYMTRKGEVLQEREKGLYRQKRALAQRIQGANDDIRNIENTYLDTIGNILENAKEHRFRYFFRFVFSDYGWDEPAYVDRQLAAVEKRKLKHLAEAVQHSHSSKSCKAEGDAMSGDGLLDVPHISQSAVEALQQPVNRNPGPQNAINGSNL